MQASLLQYLSRGLASRESACDHRTILLSWRDEGPASALPLPDVSDRDGRSASTKSGKFRREATISARVQERGREAGEHWRRLTPMALESGHPLAPENRKPNKAEGFTNSCSEPKIEEQTTFTSPSESGA